MLAGLVHLGDLSLAERDEGWLAELEAFFFTAKYVDILKATQSKSSEKSD